MFDDSAQAGANAPDGQKRTVGNALAVCLKLDFIYRSCTHGSFSRCQRNVLIQ